MPVLSNQNLEDITGNKVGLFRAPYGDYNNNVVKTAKNLGHYIIRRSGKTIKIFFGNKLADRVINEKNVNFTRMYRHIVVEKRIMREDSIKLKSFS